MEWSLGIAEEIGGEGLAAAVHGAQAEPVLLTNTRRGEVYMTLIEQIAFALRQAEDVTPVLEVCQKMGIAEQTLYRWKKRS